MTDGSLAPDGKMTAERAYNIGVTKTVVEIAHLGGISVKGEFGVLGSLEPGQRDKEDGHGAEGALSHDQLLTNPDEAVKFARETQVEALVIAMGASHGAYKFQRKPDGAILAMDVIEEIRQGITHGIRKINIANENRMAIKGQIRRVFTRRSDEFDLREYSKARDGGDVQAPQAAPSAIWRGEPGIQNQESPDAGANGEALSRRPTRSKVRVFAEPDWMSRLERSRGL